MTNQEIFDKVKAHLLTQNRKAVGCDGKCAYKAPNGFKCAVGCLIPDELYSPVIKGGSICSSSLGLTEGKNKTLMKVLETSIGPLSRDNIELLKTLQSIHDNRSPIDWPERLTILANSEGLKP